MRRPAVLATLLCLVLFVGCEEESKHGTLLVNNTSGAPLFVAIDPGQITNPFTGAGGQPFFVITLAPNQVNGVGELRRGTHNVRFSAANDLTNAAINSGQASEVTVFIRPESVTPLNIP